jgi:hypothetical protein
MTPGELAARAGRLAAEVLGPAPDALEWTAELAGWFERFETAEAELAELAGWDGELLRAAMGPPLEAGLACWRALLVTAAIRAERTDGGGGELSSQAARASARRA